MGQTDVSREDKHRERFPRNLLALMTALAVGIAIALATNAFALAQAPDRVFVTEEAKFRVRTIASNLTYPWGIAFLPNGSALVTERPGRLRLIQNDTLLDAPLQGVPRVVNLFDVAVHPAFGINAYIYLAYAAVEGDGVSLHVTRAELSGLALVQPQVIFRSMPAQQEILHSGGRLLFVDDDKLLITVGDRVPSLGQDLTSNYGSVVRLLDDGHVPNDNPYVEKFGVRPELYSYGHRNVQGITLDSGHGQVWTTDHGPIGGDELNLLRRGGNYGWPIASLGERALEAATTGAHQLTDMVEPVISWTPAIAPSGLAVYNGARFPRWKGDMFVGSLAQRHLRRLQFSKGRIVAQEVLLAELGERIRDVRAAPDGYLYCLTDSVSGRLLRLEPVSLP